MNAEYLNTFPAESFVPGEILPALVPQDLIEGIKSFVKPGFPAIEPARQLAATHPDFASQILGIHAVVRFANTGGDMRRPLFEEMSIYRAITSDRPEIGFRGDPDVEAASIRAELGVGEGQITDEVLIEGVLSGKVRLTDFPSDK